MQKSESCQTAPRLKVRWLICLIPNLCHMLRFITPNPTHQLSHTTESLSPQQRNVGIE